MVSARAAGARPGGGVWAAGCRGGRLAAAVGLPGQ